MLHVYNAYKFLTSIKYFISALGCAGWSEISPKKLRESCEGCEKLLPFASFLIDGCLGVTKRSNLPDVFFHKGVLNICNKFTGEH